MGLRSPSALKTTVFFIYPPPPLEEALGYIQAVDADSEAIYLPLLDP